MKVSHLLTLLPLASAIVIPRPNGTYSVNAEITELVDSSRTVNGSARRLMATTFYPVGDYADCSPYTIPYMPPFTARLSAQLYSSEYGVPLPDNAFEQFELQICNASSPSRYSSHKSWPLTLFTPGKGAVRQFYGALAQRLASYGYIVVTIDTPLQSGIVEYLDGSYILAGNLSTEDAVRDRVKDVSFVKQQLLDSSAPRSNYKIDQSRIAVWGHSLGGAVAGQATLEDPSFKGGVNLDGTMYGSVVQQGLKKPFMVFEHDGINDTSWHEFFAASPTRNKFALQLRNSTHNTFGDYSLLINLAGYRAIPAVEAIVGPLDGQRVLVVLTAFLDAFFKFVFTGRSQRILKRPGAAYPEMQVVDDVYFP
ncbi:1-alkyl-2-acetylglycerophosphocholine esterase-like protein [Elsinoe australis]|uniref:1-alkyl-2-acetylglycerophosphocholine esterase n=1 Tax=Elsinoe australis TaxID=40998 RepID=A0A4V6DTR8_9PEZI|nr:1-alkyl-2-acetylglycerophosphocholine esterase-like protein [Elsinoe australis]